MNTKNKILLASNVAYWPSVGGSEMVLQKILEASKKDFDRVVVFAHSAKRHELHNGVEIFPFSIFGIILFAIKYRPAVYFPNMAHNKQILLSLMTVPLFCKRTVVNIVGGYPAGTIWYRWIVLKVLQHFTDVSIHVDPLSAEYLIDRATNNKVNYTFITQGLDFAELNHYKKEVATATVPYYVYAHNLWKWKKPELFITEIVKKNPDIQFKIIASNTTGNMISEITALAQGIPNLELALGLPRAEFLRVLAQSQGVISTSSSEGAQPNIMLEVGFLGIPYFSLSPGQNYAHYPQVEMFVDTYHLSERIRNLSGKVFEQKREALTQAQKLFSQKEYNWDTVIAAINTLFIK